MVLLVELECGFCHHHTSLLSLVSFLTRVLLVFMDAISPWMDCSGLMYAKSAVAMVLLMHLECDLPSSLTLFKQISCGRNSPFVAGDMQEGAIGSLFQRVHDAQQWLLLEHLLQLLQIDVRCAQDERILWQQRVWYKTPRKRTFEPWYSNFDTIFTYYSNVCYCDTYPQIGA